MCLGVCCVIVSFIDDESCWFSWGSICMIRFVVLVNERKICLKMWFFLVKLVDRFWIFDVLLEVNDFFEWGVVVFIMVVLLELLINGFRGILVVIWRLFGWWINVLFCDLLLIIVGWLVVGGIKEFFCE